MSTVTATPIRSTDARLLEQVALSKGGAGRIDKANHLIRGVKVVGLKSRNAAAVLGDKFENDMQGYEYSPQALKDAIPLYEGVRVNLNHLPTRMTGLGRQAVASPKVGDRFGRLKNVRYQDSANPGLYGDLEYLENHEATPMVLEMAERMPETLAISHDAVGRPERRNGKIVITKISRVNSVDLIGGEGGTNSSLFEDAATKRNQQTKGTKNGDTTKTAKKPEEHLADALQTGVMAVVTNPKLDTKAKLKRLRMLIDAHSDAHSAVTGKRPSAVEECNSRRVEEDDAEESGDDETGNAGPLGESLRRPLFQRGARLLEALRQRNRSAIGAPKPFYQGGGEALAKKIRARF